MGKKWMSGILGGFLLVLATVFSANAGPDAERRLELRVTPVVKAVRVAAPAVVNITTSRIVERHPFYDFFGSRFGPDDFFHFFGPMQEEATSLGSGVIIDGKSGLVVTNAHVIAGATDIRVRLQDGRVFRANLVGSGPDFDIALLRLENARGLPAIVMGASADLMPGETVIAIGNPLGFNHTVTTGVVSALGRSIRTKQSFHTDLVQTDAAINPGNSGGPLINVFGELIGINTAIVDGASGIGFAIPVDRVRMVTEELLRKGGVHPVWTGLFGQDIDERTAMLLELPKDAGGVLVTEVVPDSPAARAAIQPGDVIVQMGREELRGGKAHLQLLLRSRLSGESMEVVLSRRGEPVRTRLVPEPFTLDRAKDMAMLRWGMKIAVGERPEKGVYVREVRAQSPAAETGIARGDRLLNINGIDLSSPENVMRAISNVYMDNAVMLVVGRNGRAYHVPLRL